MPCLILNKCRLWDIGNNIKTDIISTIISAIIFSIVSLMGQWRFHQLEGTKLLQECNRQWLIGQIFVLKIVTTMMSSGKSLKFNLFVQTFGNNKKAKKLFVRLKSTLTLNSNSLVLTVK